MRSSLYQQLSLSALVTVWPWERVTTNGQCHHGSQDEKRGWGVKNKMARACRYFVVCSTTYTPKTRFRSRWPRDLTSWIALGKAPSVWWICVHCQFCLECAGWHLLLLVSSWILASLQPSGRSCWHQDELADIRTNLLCHGGLCQCLCMVQRGFAMGVYTTVQSLECTVQPCFQKCFS